MLLRTKSLRNPTPGRTKGKGNLPQKGSEKGAEVASEKETLLEVPANPENNPAAIPLNIIKVVEPSVDEVVPDQGKEDLPQERTLGENSTELPLILSEKPSEKPEESPSESDPAKEDSAKTQRTLFNSPPPVPIPMGMVIVQSPELNQQVEAENSATSQEKRESCSNFGDFGSHEWGNPSGGCAEARDHFGQRQEPPSSSARCQRISGSPPFEGVV